MEQTKKKILIAEDEKAIGYALSTKLTNAGYETTLVPNGQEALEAARSGSFDFAILDLVMPVVDGFTVLKSFKEEGITVPTIILSNLSQEEDRLRVLDLGAKNFYVKSNTSLVKVIEEIERYI